VPSTTGYVPGSVKGGKKGSIRKITPSLIKKRYDSLRDAEPYIPTDLPDAPKSDDADYHTRHSGAKEYREKALEAVAEANLQTNKRGEIKTKVEKVPVIKTSAAQIKKETDELKRTLSKARKAGASKEELEIGKAVGSRQIAKRNYALTEDGQVKMRKVVVPVPKSEKRLAKELEQVNRTVRAIQKGKRVYEPEEEDDETPVLGDIAGSIGESLDRATEFAVPTGHGSVSMRDQYVKGAQQIADTAADAITKLGESMKAQQELEDMRLESAGLGFIPEARKAVGKGIRTGVTTGAEYLTRPGLAIEASIAQELGKPGSPLGTLLLSEKGRRKLQNAASPTEALLHGHNAKGAVDGGELSEALFGTPTLGLPIDLLTDPLMYIGFAGLPAKSAERAAALTSRLQKSAPTVLKSAQFTRIMDAAIKSGDYDAAMRWLEDAAKKNKVSLKRLGKTKADKAAIAEVNLEQLERMNEIGRLVREGRLKDYKVQGDTVSVPGKAMQAAAEEVARFGLRRELKPGFTLEVRTPLGRKLGGVEVPIPKAFAARRWIPRFSALRPGGGESIKLMEKARGTRATAEVYARNAAEHERLLNRLNDVETNPAATRAELADAEKKLADFEDGIRAQAMDARLKEQSNAKSFASLDELIKEKNSKRFAHEIQRVTNALGRHTQRTFLHHVLRAAEPILKEGDAARVRVGAHMAARADVGTRALLNDVAPLTTKEQQFLDDLDVIYKELEEYGLDVGTLKNGIENYIPRFWSTADDITGPLHAGPRSEESVPLGGRRGSASAFQHHRTLPELASIADKNKLAQMIRTIATRPITAKESLDLAEQWHRLGKVRLTMEDMAQALQRGRVMREEDMTDLQKVAYEWSQRMVSQDEQIPSLFRNLEETDGVLKLSNAAFESDAYRFVESPFTGLSPREEWRVKWSSAKESFGRLKEARELATDPKLQKEYDDLLAQRQKELDELEAARVAADEERLLPPDQTNQEQEFETEGTGRGFDTREKRPRPTHDGASAPVADEVGLANDMEIEDFLPNATQEYIGTLKDFRRDHPDKFPVLDPVLANYHRTRAEGLQTVYHTRWRALDASVGRSMTEAHSGRFRTVDGREGYTHELVPVFHEGKAEDLPDDFLLPDKPIGYRFREGDKDEILYPHDVEFMDRTLIPNREYNIWYDPDTGREYATAQELDPAVGGAIADAIGKDRLWPTDVIRDVRAEFYRMGETTATELFDSGLQNLFDRTMSLTRYGVTTLFPAFHVRNMISDALQSTMADPGFWFHPVGNAALTYSVMTRGKSVKVGPVTFGGGKVTVPHLGKMNIEDYLATMDAFGLRSNQHIAEMARLAERGDVPGLEKWFQGIKSYRRPVQVVKKGFGLGPTGAIGKRAIEFSARREDIQRVITFTQRMRRNGGDYADAMWWTIKHHFDYADLTPIERRVFRNLFLFYTWYRKNIPLQLMSIITKPGFFSAMTNTYIGLASGETPLNQDWSKINPILPDMSGPVPHAGLVPDYMINSLSALTMNWNGHALAVGFGAPWSDMNLLVNLFGGTEAALRQGLAMFNPMLSVPFQYALRKDLLTGRTFDKREASGSASVLGWLGEQFGWEIPKNEDGDYVLPWQLNLAFNQVPIGGRALGYGRTTPITEDPGRINKWFGGGPGTFLSGLNIYVSPKEGERLDAAYISRMIGRAAQRNELQQQGATDADMAAFDKQTREWAKEIGIPYKYLEVVPGIGPAYVTEEERGTFSMGGKSPLTSGGTAGTILGGGGGLNFDTKTPEFKSQTEESVEKLNNPGKFQDPPKLTPLAQGLNFGNEPTNPLAEGAGVAREGALNSALFRLRANKAAREGEAQGRSEGKAMAKADKKTKEKVAPRAKQQKNAKIIRKLHLKERHAERKKFAKRIRALRNEVNKGKLPQFEGFTDKDQEQFAQWLSVYSGLPPELVGPWVLAEGGGWGSEGVSGGEAGKNNWLGVGYPGEQTELSRYHKLNEDPKTAAKFTADWLKGAGLPDGSWKAEARIPEIVTLKDRSPQEIMEFIGNESGWGTGTFELGTVDVIGYGGKKNPTAERQLKKVEAAAKKAGFDPDEIGQTSLRLQKTLRAKKLKGSWAGSWAVLKPAIKGFEVSSEKRSPSDPLSLDNPGSDHNEANEEAFAYDLPTTDGEPIAHTVAERLGIKGYHTGDYTSWVSPKYPGYRFQILWAVEGHYDHVHVGAKWTGEDLPKGTYLGGPGSPGAPASAAYSGGGGGVSVPTAGVKGPDYKPGRSKEMEKEIQQSRQRMQAAAGGSSNVSVGSGPFLTVNEAYNLGSGAKGREGKAIVERAERELEALRKRDEGKKQMPKLGKM